MTKNFADELESKSIKFAKVDFNQFVEIGKIYYEFVEKFMLESDFYETFQKYLEFIQDNNLNTFIDLLPNKYKLKFKNSFILS